jgi:hypothetical protein
MQRLRACYRKGMLSAVVIEALQDAVPIWSWVEAPSAAAVKKPAVGNSNGRRSSASACRSKSSCGRGKQPG